ncbi:MAG: hypothetical protein ACFE85_12120 [Candidatus Hodarchaeota archaeon]
MDEIKKFIDELGIASLESNMKIASIAVVSDLGEVISQTNNWDLTNQSDFIQNVINGEPTFVLNNINFSVVETSTEGIVGTNHSGMGHVIFAPFEGGMIVSYAMPQADPTKALSFLKNYAMKLNSKI